MQIFPSPFFSLFSVSPFLSPFFPNSANWENRWKFSWAIAHSFWLRTQFERLMTPGTRKLGRRQNSSIWSFLAVFVGYSTQFLAPDTISTDHDPGYTKIVTSSKLVDLVSSDSSRGVYHTFFWLQTWFERLMTPGTWKLGRRQKSSIVLFLAVFVPIGPGFCLRGRFQRLMTPDTRKLGGRQNSSIWSFLAIFVGYST